MNENKERLLDLLSDQAVYGLSEEQIIELRRLEKEFPELRNDDSLELAAAQLALSDLRVDEPMPVALRQRILADADEFFASKEIKEENRKLEEITEPVVAPVEKAPFWQWLGWAVAAAACVVLALNLWSTRWQTQPEIVKTPPPTLTPTPEPSLAQQREQFLASTQDIIQTSWSEPDPKKAANISGDIVWSNSKQQGYMRFRGIPVNNPTESTYQLWIVDAERKEKYPVSGGTFDVTESGEVIIPIDPEIRVNKPALFAVTEEQPGGVVVSAQKEFVAVAKT